MFCVVSVPALTKFPIRHRNLSQLVGCSSRSSPFQFILFRDKMSTQPSGEMRSLAAFIQEMIRTEDVLIIAGKMRDFVSDSRQSDTVGE